MDATAALFLVSLLLLLGIYGLYWAEGRRRPELLDNPHTEPSSSPGDPID